MTSALHARTECSVTWVDSMRTPETVREEVFVHTSLDVVAGRQSCRPLPVDGGFTQIAFGTGKGESCSFKESRTIRAGVDTSARISGAGVDTPTLGSGARVDSLHSLTRTRLGSEESTSIRLATGDSTRFVEPL